MDYANLGFMWFQTDAKNHCSSLHVLRSPAVALQAHTLWFVLRHVLSKVFHPDLRPQIQCLIAPSMLISPPYYMASRKGTENVGKEGRMSVKKDTGLSS